ncbi:MAG: DDE-type integrase/transposase/recombinase [Candidatus Methylomirabilales bacterium]
MNRLKREKQLAVISALVEGNSIRSVERMTGVHRDTIMRLLNRVGERCLALLDAHMQGFHSRRLQVDEIWTFVQKKEARLTEQEHRGREIGDQYVFVALDAETKLVPTFAVGKRDGETALGFLTELRRRLNGNGRIQLTTDGLNAYLGAVEETFGADVDYAQLVKLYGAVNPGPGRYSPPRVTETISTPINGNPDPRHISTSYVERQNLTMRMQIRRFTRLTNAFSKKLANLKAALALYFAHYNFVRIHQTLRVTPGMAAGVTDRVWNIGELLS